MPKQNLQILSETLVTRSLPDDRSNPPEVFQHDVFAHLKCHLVTIMAQIDSVLRQNKISTFALSTFKMGFFLVQRRDLDTANLASTQNGYKVQA